MHRLVIAFALVCLRWSQVTHAASVDVEVRDARGAAIADAVVTALPHGTAAAAAHAAPVGHTIDQKNETFIPYIEVFRPGDKVVFHNSDRTRHHAYSFAPARQFEFVLSPGESSAPLQLDQVGVIAVGCNIHDRMITYFYVTDAPYVARTDATGVARLELPEGDYDVRVGHPQQRPGAGDDAQQVHAGAAATPLRYVLPLLPDPRVAPDRERSSY
jgi:plastocyanin